MKQKDKDSDTEDDDDDDDDDDKKSESSLFKEDFFIWQSTVENYQAARDPIDGSPFLKSLVVIICRYCYKYDLLRLYPKVNALMKSVSRERSQNVGFSTLSTISTKSFYLKSSN